MAAPMVASEILELSQRCLGTLFVRELRDLFHIDPRKELSNRVASLSGVARQTGALGKIESSLLRRRYQDLSQLGRHQHGVEVGDAALDEDDLSVIAVSQLHGLLLTRYRNDADGERSRHRPV